MLLVDIQGNEGQSIVDHPEMVQTFLVMQNLTISSIKSASMGDLVDLAIAEYDLKKLVEFLDHDSSGVKSGLEQKLEAITEKLEELKNNLDLIN